MFYLKLIWTDNTGWSFEHGISDKKISKSTEAQFLHPSNGSLSTAYKQASTQDSLPLEKQLAKVPESCPFSSSDVFARC